MDNEFETSLFKTDVDRRYFAVVEHIMAKENEFSLSKMSKKLGEGGEQLLSKIKTGKQSVGQKMIQVVVTQYNVDANWLYTGEGGMFKQPNSINQNVTRHQQGDNVAGHNATMNKGGGEDEEKSTLRKEVATWRDKAYSLQEEIINLLKGGNN